MFKFLRKPKAQATFEYAILLTIVVAAFLAIQTHLKRSVQGRLKASADDIGEQYSPGNTNLARHAFSVSTTAETLGNGVTRSEIVSRDEIYKVTEGSVIQSGDEYWGGNGGMCRADADCPSTLACRSSRCCRSAAYDRNGAFTRDVSECCGGSIFWGLGLYWCT